MTIMHRTLQPEMLTLKTVTRVEGKRLPALVPWSSKSSYRGSPVLFYKAETILFISFSYFRDLMDLMRMYALDKLDPDLTQDE
jgi:hypothetical protein